MVPTERIRTPDRRFTKPMLYQLSYVGIGAEGGNRTRVVSLEDCGSDH